MFVPVSTGAAVEIGYRHPITLRACPVFDEAGLVLLRGDADPVVIEQLPTLGEVTGFAQVSYYGAASLQAGKPIARTCVPPVAVPVRLAPSLQPASRLTASFIPPAEYPILRRMLYVLGRQALRESTVSFTQVGAVLLNRAGVESTPVGIFLRELRDGLFIAAGYDPVPAIDPEVLFRSLGSPTDQIVMMMPNSQPLAVARSSFVSLENAMIEGQSWAPLTPMDIAPALDAPIPRVLFEKAAPAQDDSSTVPTPQEVADG